MKSIEFNSSKFFSSLDGDLKYFIDEVLKRGFLLTLVGGAVRDFLLTGETGKDMDFEVRAADNSLFEDKMNDFLTFYREQFDLMTNDLGLDLEELPFQIFRIQYKEYELEFSIPRTEKYKNKNTSKSHSEFSVILDQKLEEEDSFLRRDFKINSIGVRLSNKLAPENIELVDPYNSIMDLRGKVLDSVNPDFFLDPVRFIRLVRFEIKLGFSTSQNIDLKKFNIEKLTPHYFEKEYNKILKGAFFQRIDLLLKKNNIKAPEYWNTIQELSQVGLDDDLSLGHMTEKRFLERKIHSQLYLKLCRLFVWRLKEAETLVKFFDLIDYFSRVDFSSVHEKLSDDHFLDQVKWLHELISKNQELLSQKGLLKQDLQVKEAFLKVWPLNFKSTMSIDYSEIPEKKRSYFPFIEFLSTKS